MCIRFSTDLKSNIELEVACRFEAITIEYGFNDDYHDIKKGNFQPHTSPDEEIERVISLSKKKMI